MPKRRDSDSNSPSSASADNSSAISRRYLRSSLSILNPLCCQVAKTRHEGWYEGGARLGVTKVTQQARNPHKYSEKRDFAPSQRPRCRALGRGSACQSALLLFHLGAG